MPLPSGQDYSRLLPIFPDSLDSWQMVDTLYALASLISLVWWPFFSKLSSLMSQLAVFLPPTPASVSLTSPSSVLCALVDISDIQCRTTWIMDVGTINHLQQVSGWLLWLWRQDLLFDLRTSCTLLHPHLCHPPWSSHPHHTEWWWHFSNQAWFKPTKQNQWCHCYGLSSQNSTLHQSKVESLRLSF